MTQTVISAPPRTGKTLFLVEKLEAITRKEPNRMIYTNIIGIQLPGVISIRSSTHKPFDWRDLPNGSVYVHDEAHEHPAFCKTDLLKTYEIDTEIFDNEVSRILDYSNLPTEQKERLLKKHNFVFTELPLSLKVKEQEQLVLKVRTAQKLALDKAKEDILDIGRSLTLHGHFGIDIYFITQKPDLLNSYVRASTSEHLILRRLFKLSMAIVFTYAEIQDQFGNATRKNALSWRIWFYPKKLYKYYISAESHPVKPSLPFGLIASLLLVVGLILYSTYYTKNSDAELFGATSKPTHTTQQTSNSTAANINNQSNDSKKELIEKCRHGTNVDLPECKAFFDELTKTGGSIGESSIAYDPSKPYATTHNIVYEVTAKPVFSGCMKFGSKYQAYTQQGTKLDVSQSDCERLIKDNDRPFNYFATNDNQMMTSQNSNDSNDMSKPPI